MPRIFISYKRADKEKVFAIKDKIEAATGEKCWIDLDGIESDAQFVNTIMQAIDNAEIFLFMFSKEHAQIDDYEKDWTIREINYAHDLGKRIVFINIDGTPLTKWFKFMFGLKQQVDLQSDKALQHLIIDLQKWLGISTTISTKQKQEKLKSSTKEDIPNSRANATIDNITKNNEKNSYSKAKKTSIVLGGIATFIIVFLFLILWGIRNSREESIMQPEENEVSMDSSAIKPVIKEVNASKDITVSSTKLQSTPKKIRNEIINDKSKNGHNTDSIKNVNSVKKTTQNKSVSNKKKDSIEESASIWAEARKAQLEAELSDGLEPLDYEQTMLDREKTSIDARLEQLKKEREDYDKLCSEGPKNSEPTFGLD